MNYLTIVAFLSLAVFAIAKPSGHGVVITAPAAVVATHGGWGGHGGWDGWSGAAWGGHGGWDGAWGGHGGWGGHADAIVGHGVAVVGPAAGAGHGTWNGALSAGHGHGVAVVGPGTVPAAIVGPSGKVVADGLYGVGHGGHGGHW